MAAKLDDGEKQVIVAALIAMAQEAPPGERVEVDAMMVSIVRKLDLRGAAEHVLSEAARQSTPRTRGDVG
jgi:predicted thioesterase